MTTILLPQQAAVVVIDHHHHHDPSDIRQVSVRSFSVRFASSFRQQQKRPSINNIIIMGNKNLHSSVAGRGVPKAQVGVCQKAASGDAALVHKAASVEVQTLKSTYNALSEPKGGTHGGATAAG